MLVKQPWPNLTVIMDMKTSSINTERERRTVSLPKMSSLFTVSLLTYSVKIFLTFLWLLMWEHWNWVIILETVGVKSFCRSDVLLDVKPMATTHRRHEQPTRSAEQHSVHQMQISAKRSGIYLEMLGTSGLFYRPPWPRLQPIDIVQRALPCWKEQAERCPLLVNFMCLQRIIHKSNVFNVNN